MNQSGGREDVPVHPCGVCNLVLVMKSTARPRKPRPAALEAMGEGHVTAASPSLKAVLRAGHRILERGGVSLPEAQLDRFLMNIVMDYPPLADGGAWVGDDGAER